MSSLVSNGSQAGQAMSTPMASAADRAWVDEAIRKIEGDFARTADTHLITLDLPSHLADQGIDVISRTNRRIRQAASSIAWRARWCCMPCATVGWALKARWLRPHRALRRSVKPILPG